MCALAAAAQNPDSTWSAAEPSTVGAPPRPSRIAIGVLEIDARAHRVNVGGARVRVTPMQMRLLLHLATHRDEAVSRADLLRDVWGYRPDADLQTRTVDIHVQRLRLRLGAAAALITTVRGVGYRLSEDPE
jgi:two-component system, OmpR family, phosphate regulon response regulator PhoB